MAEPNDPTCGSLRNAVIKNMENFAFRNPLTIRVIKGKVHLARLTIISHTLTGPSFTK